MSDAPDTSKATSAASQNEVFLKSILKTVMAEKQPISWTTVASYMPGNPKPDTLRKRFDKIKKELATMTSNGAEAVTSTKDKDEKVKKAPAKPLQPKTKAPKRVAEDGEEGSVKPAAAKKQRAAKKTKVTEPEVLEVKEGESEDNENDGED